MSDFIDSVLLTSNAHPYTVGLLIFTLALFVSFSLAAFTMTGLLHSDEYYDDCEDPIFIHDEVRPLLDHVHNNNNNVNNNNNNDYQQDPLRDFPRGRYVSRTVSAKRAKKQEANRNTLRRLLERDWMESSYGTVKAVGKSRGSRVGEKRKVVGREEGVEESEW